MTASRDDVIYNFISENGDCICCGKTDYFLRLIIERSIIEHIYLIMSELCYRCLRPAVVNGTCTACGAPRVVRQEADIDLLPLGTRLDNGSVIVGDKLGRGGFGVTYIARDMASDRLVALKEFLPKYMSSRRGLQVIPNTDKVDVYQKSQRAFLREAKLIRELERHPNIVNVLFVITGENNTVYYGMELLQGEDLAHRFRRQNKVMEPEEALRLLVPIIDALAFMHEKKVLHRDISPDNIFLRNAPDQPGGVSPCLIDFGAAFTAMADFTKTCPGVQKNGFSPPDQNYDMDKQGPYTDVYAFCATLYYLMTGRVPLSSMERVNAQLTPPRQLNPKISPYLDKVIMKGMAMATAERIQDMGELRKLLKKEFPWIDKAVTSSASGAATAPASAPASVPHQAAGSEPLSGPVQVPTPAPVDDSTFHRGGNVTTGKRLASLLLEWALFFGVPIALMPSEPLPALLIGYALQIAANLVMMGMEPSATLGQRLLGVKLTSGSKDATKNCMYACLRALPPIELIKELASATGSSMNSTEEMFGLRQVTTAAQTEEEFDPQSQQSDVASAASVSYLSAEAPNVSAASSYVSAPPSVSVPLTASKPVCTLQCVDGVMKGQVFVVESGAILGRKGSIRTPEDDMLVSSVHCCMQLRGDAWIVQDKESRNGTFVNGVKLPKGGVSGRLSDQDKIRIGREIFVFSTGKGRN